MSLAWRDTAPPPADRADGGIVLSSFPSAGLAATIAGHYMVKTLKLPRVGVFEGTDAQPIAVVQGGEVHPPIRVYGRSDLSIVLSELPVPPELANAAARAILDGAAARKARLVIGLEGVVPHPVEADEPPPEATKAEETVWFASSQDGPTNSELFQKAGVRRLEDGVIGGVSGALLVEGITQSTPVAVLLVSARHAPQGIADHLAGATLIEALDRILPSLKIDTAPLRTQAAMIERAIRQALKTRPRAHETPPESASPAIYG
ncbi:MAG TPA: PAC2 family protein [Thermoplasmata archaeon]|nr:PAC2 family protein [Thermoplasmata archaeon]